MVNNVPLGYKQTEVGVNVVNKFGIFGVRNMVGARRAVPLRTVSQPGSNNE